MNVPTPVPTSKKGGIYVGLCNFSIPLFSPSEDPLLWDSCYDAYDYTWSKDVDKQLSTN